METFLAQFPTVAKYSHARSINKFRMILGTFRVSALPKVLSFLNYLCKSDIAATRYFKFQMSELSKNKFP